MSRAEENYKKSELILDDYVALNFPFIEASTAFARQPKKLNKVGVSFTNLKKLSSLLSRFLFPFFTII